MEQSPLNASGGMDAVSDDALAQTASRLIQAHQREDGSIALPELARQLPPAAQAHQVETPRLAHEVAARLPIPTARKLLSIFPPASLAPRAPWKRKGCVYRALDTVLPLRWTRYRLGQSRYAWVRQRAADRQGLDAFTVVERATDAAIARFARVVDLHRFADLFTRDTGFRDEAVALVREHAAPELQNPSGADQRLNMVALLDLSTWHANRRSTPSPQLGAELVMLSIPAAVFDRVTAAIRQGMDRRTPCPPPADEALAAA